MATSTTGVSLVLSGKWLYALLIFLLAVSVIGTFVFSFVPNFLGIPSAAASLLALFAYVAHDLETDPSSPAPGWVSYIVVAVGGGLMAGAGYFAHNPTLTETSLLAFALVVLSFIYHSFATDAGAKVPAYIEVWLTALTGAGITIVQFVQSNPTASTATIVVTIVLTLASVIHVTEEGGKVVITPSGTPA